MRSKIHQFKTQTSSLTNGYTIIRTAEVNSLPEPTAGGNHLFVFCPDRFALSRCHI